MKSVTISMRLPEAEVRRLEELAQQMRMEKPVFIKRALRRGARIWGSSAPSKPTGVAKQPCLAPPRWQVCGNAR